MRARRLVPSPALVVASLALVIAAAQPVGAAVGSLAKHSVGTRQLKDSAITTRKIHDAAVTGAKLGPGAVTSAKIADGSVTLTDLDPTARPSQSSPPKAYAASTDLVNTPADGSSVTVATINVPAGTWAVHAKANATTTSNGSSGDAVVCHLYQGETSVDFATSYSQVNTLVNESFTHSIPLQALVTVGEPTQIDIRCSESNESLDAYVQAIKLMAVQVTP